LKTQLGEGIIKLEKAIASQEMSQIQETIHAFEQMLLSIGTRPYQHIENSDHD